MDNHKPKEAAPKPPACMVDPEGQHTGLELRFEEEVAKVVRKTDEQ